MECLNFLVITSFGLPPTFVIKYLSLLQPNLMNDWAVAWRSSIVTKWLPFWEFCCNRQQCSLVLAGLTASSAEGKVVAEMKNGEKWDGEVAGGG